MRDQSSSQLRAPTRRSYFGAGILRISWNWPSPVLEYTVSRTSGIVSVPLWKAARAFRAHFESFPPQ